MKTAKMTLMALALLLALLLVHFAPSATAGKPKVRRYAVVYTDLVNDTIQTKRRYHNSKRSTYIHECSCDAIYVKRLR